MKTYAPMDVVNSQMGSTVTLNERCCGESGTLAVTRPDVSTQVRFRKEVEMRKGAASLRAVEPDARNKVLTSCPSCLQGLSPFDGDAGTQADYIVVEMAWQILGDNWMSEYVERVNAGGIERVLLRLLKNPAAARNSVPGIRRATGRRQSLRSTLSPSRNPADSTSCASQDSVGRIRSQP